MGAKNTIKPPVEIIVIGYNVPKLEKECIASVKEHTKTYPHKLTYFDNYKTGLSLTSVWNKLIDQSECEYICLLNSDTIVYPEWLDILMYNLLSNDKICAVGPSTNHAARASSQEKIKTYAEAKKYHMSSKVKTYYPLCGFCLVFRKSVWKELNGFDERLHFYGQESYFLKRAMELGYSCYWCKKSFVFHHGEASVKANNINLNNARNVGAATYKKLMKEKLNIYVPKVSVIIVTHNQSDYTIACIDSIIRNTKIPIEIIWVDNGSSEEEFYKVAHVINNPILHAKVHRSNKNLGFIKAVNIGLKHTHKGSKYIILLNNDTIIGPNTFEKLIYPMDIINSIGIVGPLTQGPFWQGIQQYKKYKKIDLPNWRIGTNVDYFTHELEKKYKNKILEETDKNLAFFCCAIRRDLFMHKLKGLDEDLYNGMFDDDLSCYRARKLGYKIFIALDAFVFHHVNVTFNALGINVQKLSDKNKEIYLKKIENE